VKTAAQAAANWQASQGRATQAYSDGVAGYQGDWAGATIRQQSVMQANYDQAVANGTWARGVSATGTGGWKQATEAKKGNYSTGFSAGAQAQAAAAQKIQQALASIVPNLPARGTYEQNKIRSTTLMDALHAQRGQLGAR
jgi:hypothetical protein